MNTIADSVFASLEEKIDISVYFKQETDEKDILQVKSDLASLGEVKKIDYISQSAALDDFKEKHKDNSVLMQSLEELKDNPLEASLNVKAKITSQYAAISQFLGQEKYQNIISKINYKQNELAINKLANIISGAKKSGILISLALAIIALSVTFNTFRIVIYTNREEIGVMKLVGASNWFARGPFVASGIFYGIFSALITLAIFYPLIWFASPRLVGFLSGINLQRYFLANFWQIFALLLITGVAMGAISSLIAIRRYLRV